MAYNTSKPGPGGPSNDADVVDPLLKPDRKVIYFEPETPAGQRPTLRAALVDEDAQRVAQAISELPASQLRRFYSSVLNLKRELEINPTGTGDALVMARLALLKAHTAYAKKRMDKMPDEFVKFIVRHVAAVKTKNDFLYGFAPCFEAVVAYHKLYEKKGKRA